MKTNLYEIFDKAWNKGGVIYFYSDPHFNDTDMVHLRHNYIGDEEQVACINKVVGKKDTIVFLGDIGDTDFIKKVRGYKVLIMGNHDKGASNYKRAIVDGVDNHLFDEVYSGPLMISDKILLSHEPINLPYVLNIHGHDHSGWHKIPHGLNVCAELINYFPVPLTKIMKSGMLNKVDDIHRCAIDMAIIHKLPKK